MINRISNNQGQSLVEYLIIVALVAVATIGVVRVVGHNISANFVNISNALANNKSKAEMKNAGDQLKKKNFGNFMDGATGDQ
jgi:Flp pilus assembly pilin Flp